MNLSVFECLMFTSGIVVGLVASMVFYHCSIKRLKQQLYKLKGQVYYWSRQMPVAKKRGRPRKKSV